MAIERMLVLVTALGGCFLPLPPEHTYDDERHVTVNWALKGPADAAGQCPSGFDTVLVEACIEEELYSCFSAMAPCEPNGSLDLTVYTSGRYRPDENSSFFPLSPQFFVYVSLTDAAGETREVSSTPQLTDLAAGDKTVDTTLYPDAGFLRLEWTPSSAASGSSATNCAELSVDEIELAYAQYTSSDPPLTEHVRWPCETLASMDPDPNHVGDGDTEALAPGSYIGDAIAYRAGAEVGRYTDVTFSIEDRGKVTEASAYITITDR